MEQPQVNSYDYEIIADEGSYKEHFGEEQVATDKNKQKEALKQALDIRKFEIELYWKRATYFWTFLAATFAGYFTVMASSSSSLAPNRNLILFILNCLGLTFSYSWYLVNRGSKFWLNNWEKHVDMLEDEVMGPLYKTVQGKKPKYNFFTDEGAFSVSKINQLLSLYVVAIWVLMGIATGSLLLAPDWVRSNWSNIYKIPAIALILLTLLGVILIHGLAKSSSAKGTSDSHLFTFTKRKKPL